MSFQNQPRPLLTIAILVFGVLGGLAVVITVVYFYKLCLKRRAPITTTGKPDQKRSQIRSLVNTQCRNLTLTHPQYIQIAGQQYKAISNSQYVVPDLVVSEVITDDSKYYQDLSNHKIRYTMPNIPRNLPKISHNNDRKKLSRCGGSSTNCSQQQLYDNNFPSHELPIKNKEKTNNFLTPDNNFNSNGRTKSAEMLLNVEVNDETRRASTGSMYHPVNGIIGQRRRLPSITHLSPIANLEYYNSNELNNQNRKLYGLSRSQAIDNRDVPLKQFSSPLPFQRDKIYSRQHAFSKSWNIEDHSYRNDVFIQPNSVQQSRHKYVNTDNFVPNYYQISSHHIIPPVINLIPPTQSPRSPYTSPEEPQVPKNNAYPNEQRNRYRLSSSQQQYTYQSHYIFNNVNPPPKIDSYPKGKASSFDERTALLYEKSKKPPNYTNPPYRTLSEADKKNLIRQQTIQLLQPDSVISKQCLDVWKDRKNFEVDPLYLNQLSTDWSDDNNSVSTSFESNSESPTKDKEKIRKEEQYLSTTSKSSEGANIKRQKFRDIMLKRQLLDDMSTGVETSSYDSSLDNPQHCVIRDKLLRDDKNYHNIMNVERDYSIDSKSDTLFRLFSSNDPKYMTKGVKSFHVKENSLNIIYQQQCSSGGCGDNITLENSTSYEEYVLPLSQQEENESNERDNNIQTKNRQIFWQYKRVSSKEDSDVT
uniref:SH3 domain-containing protein n=1 Tax=Strongyloides papillosus TaxID=174720 RepID=A0A0N5BBH5_STREA